MTNKIQYAQNEISNNQGNKVTITIVRGVFEKNVSEETRRVLLERAKNNLMGNKNYSIYHLKDEDEYSYILVEGMDNLSFTDITKEVTSC